MAHDDPTFDELQRHDVEVFVDNDCPLCRREVNFLRRRDKHQRILFTDISSPEFDATRYDHDMPTLMAEIRGRLPDGTWIKGVEVFRHLYLAVGWKLPVALSRLPVIRPLLDVGYTLFARNRLRMTGRCRVDGKRCE